MTRSSTTGTSTAATATVVVRKAIARGPWLHAVVAAVVGVVFGFFLRTVGFAALLTLGTEVLLAVAVVLAAAIAFGAIGRVFTRSGRGWLLLLTPLIWAPAVMGVAFFVFAGSGTLNQLDPFGPLAGGVAAAFAALLAHKGAPRVVGILGIIAAVAVVAVFLMGSTVTSG
jgi:hypothetical protein